MEECMKEPTNLAEDFGESDFEIVYVPCYVIRCKAKPSFILSTWESSRKEECFSVFKKWSLKGDE
jgi:hypothetical protein